MVVGQRHTGTLAVQQMRPGDHAFLCYGPEPGAGASDGWDVLSAFIWSGLAHGEKVLVAPPPRLPKAAVWARIQQAPGPLLATGRASGQLSLTDVPGFFGPGTGLRVDRQHRRLRTLAEAARRDGYTGLRLYADMGWAIEAGADQDALVERESHCERLFTDGFYSEICAYDKRLFPARLLDTLCRAHPCNLLPGLGRLHALHDTGTVRIIGEADIATREPFRKALAAGLSGAPSAPPLTVDLTGLTFLGTECAADLVAAVRAGRRRHPVRVRCSARTAALLHHIGADRRDIDVPAG